jgi:hypothetical protein
MTDTRDIARWIEIGSKDYPVLDWLPRPFARPLCTRETIQEPVEPYYTSLQSLKSQLPYECSECGGEPDPAFYQPTEKLLNLQKGIAALEPKAWREIPNPAYDPEKAAAWEKDRSVRFNQTRIEVGQSYNPEVNHP